MISFLHTADLQIGKPFHWANDRAQSKLRERREGSIDEIARVAGEKEADFVLVAGDLFDDNTVGDDVITRTCRRLETFEVPVLVIPGNHDFAGGPGCVFMRDKFESNKSNNIHVLTEENPFVLMDGKVVILPAPVCRKDEVGDPTGHITAQFGQEEAPDAIRIGLAHGGVIDFQGGEALSRIDPARALEADLDYLALGDWHGCKEVDKSTWYSGTPEPDSFKDNNPGHVLYVEIEGHGATPTVEQVKTGQTDWLRAEYDIRALEDVEALERWFSKLKRPLDTLVRLELTGTLGFSEKAELEDVLSDISDTVLHLRRRGEGVRPRATPEEIESLATDGYVKTAVDRLGARAEAGGEEADIAQEALQLLYRFKHS